MLRRVRLFLEMIRFSHTLFALPFALLSAALAWHTKPQGFHWIELLGIVLCMAFARSAAMAYNRIADREIDALNPRTAKRHIPAGLLSVRAVWGFTAACALGFIGSTALFLLADPPNVLPLILSVPVLLFVAAYSHTKRFTPLAHFWLGASLLLAPVSAWVAIRGLEGIEIALVLGAAVFFWVAGFDIIYACQDAEFDRKSRLASIPATFGVAAALRLALLCHITMVLLLLLLAWLASPPLGIIFLIGVVAVAALLAYEHWLVSPADLTRVNQAFFQVNAVVSLGLFLVVLIQLAVR
jgi:4-hydroxybenzoate polyprenyltransferase